VIETPRLRLRRLRPSDEGDLIALDSDPEVMRHVGSPAGTRPADETAARVRQRIAEDQAPLGFWLVESRAGVAHGLCALLRMPAGVSHATAGARGSPPKPRARSSAMRSGP